MARGRMLNKKISRDKDVATLINKVGPWGGVFYTWMIAHLDREGRVEGDPDVLKGAVVPRLSGCTPELIRTTLVEAHELGLLIWYEAEGDDWVSFPKFSKNQIGLRTDREAVSDCPPPPDGAAPPKFRSRSGVDPEKVGVMEWNGMEVNLKEDQVKLNSNKVNNQTNAILKIIEHYESVHPLTIGRTKQGSATWKKVAARLKEGFTSEQICKAIDGNASDQWYKENGKYELAFTCQSDARINEMLNKYDKQHSHPCSRSSRSPEIEHYHDLGLKYGIGRPTRKEEQKLIEYNLPDEKLRAAMKEIKGTGSDRSFRQLFDIIDNTRKGTVPVEQALKHKEKAVDHRENKSQAIPYCNHS